STRHTRDTCQAICQPCDHSAGKRKLFLFSEQLLNVFSRTPKHRSTPALYNRSLDQIRMLDHHRDQFAVAEFVLRQSELFVDRLTLPQKIARLQVHFTKQLREFLLTQRLNVVINFLKRNATLTEQLVHLATLGSSWFFVNCEHLFFVLGTWFFVSS